MRRLCLYAGYSDKCVIDDYVLFYIEALSQHCDVYYFADSSIPNEELSKLDPFVKGREAYMHGKYDFGSWQKLIFQIGWNVIHSYDALILVNDSNFGPIVNLSSVFDKMDSSRFDFWGITENNGVHIHLQSYFLNFYRKAFSSIEFRELFENIERKKTKEEICLAYEIGLSKILYKSGFSFGSYIDRAKLGVPFGADVSSYQNTLIRAGSPFLKRKLFTDPSFAVENLDETFKLLSNHNYPDSLITNSITNIVDCPQSIEATTQGDVESNLSNFSEVVPNGSPSKLRSIAKKILMPFYKPFKHRFVDRLFAIENRITDTNLKIEKVTTFQGELQNHQTALQNSLNTISDSVSVQFDRGHKAVLSGLQEQQASLARIFEHMADLHGRIADAQTSIVELHGHVDWAQRDILIALKNHIDFAKSQGFSCTTDHPIAYDSPDHIHPVGTLVDHTRHPRFIRACEDHFADRQTLSFLDLGCSAGGIVWDAILRGHIGIGLEGSDISRLQQRAEWRLLRESLFTCDITKPFALTKGQEEPYKFDVISAWEVLEHLTAEGVHGLFENLKKHTHSGSIFGCSISQVDGGFTDDGVPLHQTLEPLPWWKDAAGQHGFILMEEGPFSKLDFARGNGNASIYYRPEHSYRERPGDCLLAVFKRA